MLGFYMALYIPSIGEPAYGFIKVMSFVPFMSPFMAVGAYTIGAINLLEILLALLVNVVAMVGLMFLISPLYKASILSYDNGKLLSRIKKVYSRSKSVKEK